MRVPYPMGFHARGLDGRIDDPDAGWKGRGLWSTVQHGSTDGEIDFVIRNGIPPELVMEPFDDRLDETDTWNIVNYLSSLQKTR